MYRFSVAESANPNDYVGTGAAAGKGALLSQQTVLRNSPNYAKLSLRGGREKAKNEINAAGLELANRREERDLARSEFIGTANEAQLKSIQTAIDQKRFAGKLALAGELYEQGFGEKTKRREPFKPDFDRTESLIKDLYNPLLQRNTQRRETLFNEIEGLEGNNMTNPSSPKTGSEIPNANNPGYGINIGDTVGGDEFSQPVYPVQPGVGGGDPYQKMSNSSSFDYMNPSRYALSRVVQFAEGTKGPDAYRVMFGHRPDNPRLLDDFSRHPNKPYPTGWGTDSPAAGAYQFMPPTWTEVLRANPDIRDFSPESQERAFDWLARRRDVDPYAPISNFNQFKQVMNKFAPEWASLPTLEGVSYYGQPVKTHNELYNVYLDGLKNPPYPAGMI